MAAGRANVLVMHPSAILAAPVAAAVLAGAPCAAQNPADEAAMAVRRQAMVALISEKAAGGVLGGQRAIEAAVLRAMREVPRHRFVPRDQVERAYEDTPLPIGHDSTISQPLVVATMTDLLDVRPGNKVLEVGTGSGYQAAILQRMGARVYSIEIVPELARTAAERLVSLGYRGISVRAGDGYKGWPEAAPFDAIMVTAGATHVPAPLVEQLKPGGRMLIPMGPYEDQRLTLVTKDAAGKVTERSLSPVRFIPLDERAREAK